MTIIAALGSVIQGDRIWWTWKGNDMDDDFCLLRIQQNEIGKRTVSPMDCKFNFFDFT